MSDKLSVTQLEYVKWLSLGNSIHICIELCNKFGSIAYSSALPFDGDKRALNKLYRLGLIQTRDEYNYGLRWIVIELNKRGYKYLERK